MKPETILTKAVAASAADASERHGADLAAPPVKLMQAAAAPPPAVKLDARHITFRYGDTVALKDVSVPIYRNKVTAFIGPSGCGKSTLLRIFNLMHRLYRDQHVTGEMLLDGRNILDPAVDAMALRARIGMVAQKPTPFPMSIYDNVALGARLNEDLSPADLDRRVEQSLRRAALWEEVRDILPTSGLNLSGGQQQRLCIARTIAVRPEVILLDEPCSALDPVTTARIEETIDELKVDHTIVIVTHNLQQAARIADYAAVMYLGELIEFGTAREIFLSPRDERARQFVTGQIG